MIEEQGCSWQEHPVVEECEMEKLNMTLNIGARQVILAHLR